MSRIHSFTVILGGSGGRGLQKDGPAGPFALIHPPHTDNPLFPLPDAPPPHGRYLSPERLGLWRGLGRMRGVAIPVSPTPHRHICSASARPARKVLCQVTNARKMTRGCAHHGCTEWRPLSKPLSNSFNTLTTSTTSTVSSTPPRPRFYTFRIIISSHQPQPQPQPHDPRRPI